MLISIWLKTACTPWLKIPTSCAQLVFVFSSNCVISLLDELTKVVLKGTHPNVTTAVRNVYNLKTVQNYWTWHVKNIWMCEIYLIKPFDSVDNIRAELVFSLRSPLTASELLESKMLIQTSHSLKQKKQRILSNMLCSIRVLLKNNKMSNLQISEAERAFF